MESEPKGEVFYSTAVMCAKEAWRKWLEEQDRLTVNEMGPSPFLVRLRDKWAREEAELTKAMLERPLLGFPTVMNAEPMFWNRPIVQCKVCECGVAFTGGLHSDWCPLKSDNG